jgi:hypothetical protein
MENNMENNKDWFSVNTQYNVENADQLFELINFLISEAQAEYQAENTVEDTELAQQMLANIGVRCAKTC